MHFSHVFTPHCGSRLKVSQRVPHKKMFMHVSSHVSAFVVSLFCPLPLSLVPLLFLSVLPVLCLELQLPCGRDRRALNPMRTRRTRSIAPWRYTTLSRFMSPTSSTTSSTTPTTQKLMQRSSRMNPSTWTRNRRTRAMRNSTMSLSEKRYLHHCSFRSDKNQRT